MDLCLSKPSYRCRPIRTVAALARAIGFDEGALRAAADAADQSYRVVPPEPGSSRQTFDAKGRLKEIHRRLKVRIFAAVEFPEYLQGSLKGRDYVTNAKLHTNKRLLICEDVKSFFPSITAQQVMEVWCGFFGFAPAVADVLTKLTTKDGAVPQGAITSSYLANLALWRDEPLLQAKFMAHGITYSRYVDDIAMSSKAIMPKQTQTWCIAQVHGMLLRNGLRASRKKHEIFTASKTMVVTKLTVNKKPSLSQAKKSQVRAQVRQLEMAQASGVDPNLLRDLSNKAAQRVGQFGRFHPTQAGQLKGRVAAVRAGLPAESRSAITISKRSRSAASDVGDERPPWE